MNRKARSKYLQITLRTSMAITTLVAILFAYLAYQDAKRRQLISDIKTAGGVVEFDNAMFTLFSSSRVSKVTLPYAKIGDVQTSRMKSLKNLEELILTDVQTVIDNGIQMRFPEMRITDVTDEALDGLDEGVASVSLGTR